MNMPHNITAGLRIEQMDRKSLDTVFSTDLQNLMLSAAEAKARILFKKDMFKSGIVMPVDYSNTENSGVRELFFTNNTIKNMYYEGFFTRPLINVSSSDSNKLYFAGKPHKFNINGMEVYISFDDSSFLNHIKLPPPPPTGSRQDMVMLEVWLEEIVSDVSNSDVIFPYGNTQYYSDDLTFKDCTLSNQNLFGGNYPEYLSTTEGHGKYINIGDPNVMRVILDPLHNIFIDENNKIYQIRYRIAVLTNNLSHTAETPFLFDVQHMYYRPQGQKGSRPARGIQTENLGVFVKQNGTSLVCSYEHDPGLFLSGWFTDNNQDLQPIEGEVSYDGRVYMVPLALVFRRNSTPYSPLTNPNGAGLISSGISGRDDGLFADHVYIDDVINMTEIAKRNNYIFKEKPSGNMNGTNKTFYIRYTPVPGSEHVFYNGQLLDLELGDYTIDNKKIILNSSYETAPLDKLRVSYITK